MHTTCFRISLHLHFTKMDIVKGLCNLQRTLVNTASRDPAGTKGNFPVPISQMRKLMSREATPELGCETEEGWTRPPKAALKPWLPA